ncbi:hypothetical protein G7Y89_g6130 [Cudoniella acicularis]|uniref:Thioredoxin-like fold domain-containing protein n=1 Tax=Cudoniella acicularis TaxID=354080 RepID=A0A8H4RL28_9HELO|nr:hypothetical protein G7Y89_g6130 [Cudoniella acicularis]
MPPTKTLEKKDEATSAPETSLSRQTRKIRDFFSIPPPVKTLFDNVPLLVYPANELPQRAPKPSRIPSLYVFSKKEDAAAGRPSFNPSCLKWQAFLNIAGINHRLVASSNHASPSGSLPFLLPATISSNTSSSALYPIPSNRLIKYAEHHGSKVEESSSMRYEAYQSLLDHRIRSAWLYTLYLEPLNFSAVAYPLYVSSTSSNPLVRASISHQLRSAAETELLKHSSIIDTDDLYSEADKAFEALSILLGNNSWFFGNRIVSYTSLHGIDVYKNVYSLFRSSLIIIEYSFIQSSISTRRLPLKDFIQSQFFLFNKLKVTYTIAPVFAILAAQAITAPSEYSSTPVEKEPKYSTLSAKKQFVKHPPSSAEKEGAKHPHANKAQSKPFV